MKRDRGIVTRSDAYKIGGHFNMYQDGTTLVHSYFGPRIGARFNKTVFFSLQYILKEKFVGKVVTQKMIDKAEALCEQHLGKGNFNKKGWQYILDVHDGILPLSIKAVPEGSVVDIDNVLFTVENTDPNCFWLTNYVESILSHVWYGSTVATLAANIKSMIFEYLVTTADDPEATINFALHDFGYRSASSDESADIAAGAHLLSFRGTDTTTGIEFLMDYYGADVCGWSVIATEHSVMSSRGREGEFDVLQDVLNKYRTGILSVVIDTYSWRNFIKVSGTTFKYQILNRDGKFVFRPDSGPPVETTLEILEMLGEYFGYTYNKQGYKILNPKIGVLWGDGINKDGVEDILKAIRAAGWCCSNLIFGMGGHLNHSDVKRDTQRCAFKSSYQIANGVGINTYKDPLDSSKKSKKGRLALVKRGEKYVTLEEVKGVIEDDLLVEVFRDGEMLVEYTLDDIKANLNK